MNNDDKSSLLISSILSDSGFSGTPLTADETTMLRRMWDTGLQSPENLAAALRKHRTYNATPEQFIVTMKFTRGSVTQQTRYITADGMHDFHSPQLAEQCQARIDLRRLINQLSPDTDTVSADEILANATLFYDLLADILGKEDAT